MLCSITYSLSRRVNALYYADFDAMMDTKNNVLCVQIYNYHMGQYQLLSVLAIRLSPLNIDHSDNLPVEICGISNTEKYTNL